MVEWPRTVNPVLKKRNRFESYHLHQVMEMWQSPVYCNSLENCRPERGREFESHRFRQTCESGEMVYSGDLKSPVERHAGSSPASRTKL